MFEKASRMKLRFNTQRGVLSVEDLWDLPLIQLDNIAIALNKKLQESKTESFIKTRTKDTTELELKFNIAKHIIDVKLQEQEDRLLESEKKAKRQKILDHEIHLGSFIHNHITIKLPAFRIITDAFFQSFCISLD